MKTMARAAAAAVGLCLLLAGCSGSDEGQPGQLRGFVMADDPVAGALLRIVGADGREVPLSAPVRSHPTGAFAAGAARLPDSFTVIASGGTWRGQPLVGELRYRARYATHQNVLYLTPVSTLAAAYAQARLATDQEAESAVAAYLRLPRHHTLRNFKRHADAGFSATDFMAQARAQGGLDAFVARLALDVGPGRFRAFTGAAAGLPMVDAGTVAPVLQWAAVQISKAAGADQFTAFLTSFGPAQVPAELAQAQQRIDQVSSQISQLNDLVQSVASDLKCAIGQYGYEGSLAGAAQSLAALKDIAANMDVLAGLPKDDPSYAAQLKYVMDQMGQNAALHDIVHTLAVGSSTLDVNGAIRNLSRKLTGCGHFLNPQKSGRITAQYQYWVSAQVSACQLVVSYRKALGLAAGSIQNAVDACGTYIADLSSDALAITGTLPAGSRMVVDTRTDLMYLVKGQVAGTVDDIGPIVSFGPLDPGWFIPSETDVGSFLNGAANRHEATTRDLLAKAGWSDYDATTDTYSDWFGPGGMFFWTAGPNTPRLALSASDPGYTMAWNGVTGEVRCACAAMVMQSRTTEGVRYYAK